MGMNTTLVGIALAMLLLALPVAASDYTLGIFGNANEDDTINMQDVTYTELIILEYRDRTELSDAKYDDRINMQEVDDWIFDDITKTFILDDEMRKFFEENNPWALEEIGRMLLEAYERGLWDADPEVIDGLKNAYLEMEGWIEERMGDVKGDFQGGSIDVMTMADVAGWKEKVEKVLKTGSDIRVSQGEVT